MRTRRRQRGWLGLVVMLLALVVVAMLGRTVLREMGLLGGRPPVADSGGRDRLPPGATPAGDASPATPASSAPIDRARAVEDMVQQGAADRGRRIGDAEK